jgi:short-subunit dehydrogenase
MTQPGEVRAPPANEPAARVLIVGVTSAIGRAVAAAFAARGQDLLVTGRNREELEAVAADLRLRHRVEVEANVFDAMAFDEHDGLMDAAGSGPLRGVVMTLGYMGDHDVAQSDFREARRIVDTNYTACVSLLEKAASILESRGHGFICVVGSVAGDRGRQSNYLYGSAKAGLDAYLQGLRNRLHPAGVTVTTVKPGFVDTRMTYGKEGMFLVASPDAVGRGIYRAARRGRSVVYLPGFWRLIMWVIRSIPEPVFKRLKL